MRVALTVLASASAFLFGTATVTLAQNPKYAVDGLAVGSQLKFDSAAYSEYKCSPSDQFDGFTRCQRARNEQERRGAFTTTYSILHAQDGSVIYVNRFQEPAFLGQNEADKDIQQYSRKIGESARITKMPHRAGLPDGLIALWGKTTLEQLDQDSTKILAEGRSLKKGLLIDFIGNFARSAKEGLPIYRISGGAGFLWAASFDQGGRGTLRIAAIDVSALSSPLPGQATAVILPTPQQGNAPETNIAELKQTIETLQADLAKSVDKIAQLEKEKATAVILPTPQPGNAPETNIAELKQTIETLQADLAKSVDKIAQLEKEKTERAENAKEIERTKVAEKANLDAMLAQFEADKAALDAKSRAWEISAYGAIIGAIVFLIVALVQGIRSRKATKGRYQLSEAAIQPGRVQTHAPENSERPVPTNDARELDAKDSDDRDIEPGEETKPSKSLDQGDLVNQLAETPAVQEPAVSSSDLTPESAEKSHRKQ